MKDLPLGIRPRAIAARVEESAISPLSSACQRPSWLCRGTLRLPRHLSDPHLGLCSWRLTRGRSSSRS